MVKQMNHVEIFFNELKQIVYLLIGYNKYTYK